MPQLSTVWFLTQYDMDPSNYHLGAHTELQPVIEHVGHGPKLGGPLGAQRLGRRAGATTSATNQRQLDRVVFAGITAGGNLAQQGRAGQRRLSAGPRAAA